MTVASFSQAARKPIIDPELDVALSALGEEESPDKDALRFDLYMAAINRAKINKNDYPDLPASIVAAFERARCFQHDSSSLYAYIDIPRHVSIAYARRQNEDEISKRNQDTGFVSNSAPITLRHRD